VRANDWIALASGMPPIMKEVCEYCYQLQKLIETGEYSDERTFIKIASLSRLINSRLLFMLGEASRKVEGATSVLKEYIEDIKTVEKDLVEIGKGRMLSYPIMAVRVGLNLSKVFDIFNSVKQRMTFRFPSEEEIESIADIIFSRLEIAKNLMIALKEYYSHPLTKKERDFIPEVKSLFSKYVDIYIPDFSSLLDKIKPVKSNPSVFMDIFETSFVKYIESLIYAIKFSTKLERKYGYELPRKYFFMDFDEEYTQFYKLLVDEITKRLKIEVEVVREEKE